MLTVDFIYADTCPNVGATRSNLIRAFARAKLPARWEEFQIGSPDAPPRTRGFGSPTILVKGVDVAGMDQGAEDSCRIYAHGGVPDVDIIAHALARAQARAAIMGRIAIDPRRHRWRSIVAMLPGIGIALLPKVVCPLCWPAYAGALSAVGLTFLMEDQWLLPIGAALLLAALGALGWRAPSRRGYGPLGLGAMSAIAILLGRFALSSTTTVYIGAAALLAACVWNLWPHREAERNCASCRRPEVN